MSAIAIVMMLLFMAVIWGGLVLALVRLTRAQDTGAARQIANGDYVAEH